MRRAVQRFLPSRTQSSGSTTSIKKALKFDSINLIQDFYIDLDEPHKIFKPGENIKGTIILDLKRNITDINITMTLVGFIKVKQTNNTAAVRSKPTLLFRNTTVIYGEESNKENEYSGEQSQENIELPLSGLTKGEHRFPFSIRLPRRNIYTSITFEKGSISYSLRGSINHTRLQSPTTSLTSSPASLQSQSPNSLIPTTKNSIQHCDKNLQIIVPINVAKIPKPSTKVAVLKISDKALKKTVSSTSTVNSNTTQFTVASDNSIESLNNNNNNDNNSNNNTSQPSNPIPGQQGAKLYVDLPESGYLRGETVPLKIRVQHYKPIQSSAGVIVTLIRICRVDNGPEAPIQSFRKDLSQTIAPLYIDPASLTADISTSLKVPLESFPTIVGSGLVTFQYYVEVLVNISSKNLITNNGTSSTCSKSSKTKFSHSLVFNTEDPQEMEMSRSETGVLNVDRLKRIKNFLGLNTEIIIGTERSHKNGSLGKKTVVGNALHHNNGHINNSSSTNSLYREDSQNGDSPIIMDSDNSIIEGFSQTSISPLSINGTSNGVVSNGNQTNGNTSVVSTGEEIPIPEEDPHLSEKEILRIREAALLPSEPIINDDDTPAPSYSLNSSDLPPLPESNTSITADHSVTLNGIAPAVTSTSNSTYTNQSTDKAELERRRLQELESEPPEFDYVPEYNPAGQDRLVHVSTQESENGTLRPSSP
ncbi:pH-response regulator protein [Wickerhamomyces ciferrii]|uniref:pH-response regulator protein palF/RIM8 n=1 Tax=Wickerhamomyces ciferrii (strain ATCC 14091 / BCRC 22168 / CBS 111 / JCM 3599 / NBRC 0793 / NRRL Y-1031 F-60-10) TaxID=1206466 RepID=K0KW20_WICCF|nr:pH-response regulator protein [Wickerhamomyces ciferrii]CCH45699.1 pH-response regulator protein [Wickerhamomyces ciferrii]